MIIRNAVLVLTAAAAALAGCTHKSTIRLIDGRSFTPERVENDGQRLQFQARGWSYNLPAGMLAKSTNHPAVKVLRIEITRDAIAGPAGPLTDFQELMQYLDRHAAPASPVILVLPDVMSWPEARRREFGNAYGEVHGRPDVGLEAPWPDRWMPSEVGREQE
ncbi:MAG TPA: hypothetical protein PL039_00555 [Kiritimatiellia bacterium]|jgi:hypothetical protein|nr:hypothetical protein [Kiritimatiellia bacterium]HQQ60642.1 hypothetical protein [Kiritimatiellia bacterium]